MLLLSVVADCHALTLPNFFSIFLKAVMFNELPQNSETVIKESNGRKEKIKKIKI